MKWLWNEFRKTRLFWLGVVLYLAAVLPFIIYRGGIFFYYGDYNVQQVPFYILAHRAVRSGNFFWNFNIDLGSSTGGSFAFYLWGSPFFWFSCLFPEKWLPYMMPFFMSLKYGTALCTSYAWLRHNVRTQRGALLGALLYTFSGFSACNIVFQHFHEAIAFFPLYLLMLDRFHERFAARALASSRQIRRSLLFSAILGFALMTAAMSMINYFFFFGQVVFLILYWCIRYLPHQRIRCSLSEALLLIASGLLGLCLAAFFLIQVWDTVSGNTRLSDILLGYDMLAYSEPATPLAILKSMFLLPDLVGRGTLFTSDQIRNSSLSLFIPCFAVSGAIAFLRSRRKDWRRNILLSCLVIAFVPILNSAFALFNSEYYARWFYMPILFISMVTVQELEDKDRENLMAGAAITLVADTFFLLCALLPTASTDEAAESGIAWFQIMEYPELFLTEVIVTAVMVPALLMIVGDVRLPAPRDVLSRLRTRKLQQTPANTAAVLTSRNGSHAHVISRTALVLVTICCLLTQMGVLYNGSTLIAKSGCTKWRSQMLENKPEIPGYGEAAFERIETDGTSTNYEMVWGYPSLHCFQSTVSPGVFAFYQGIGYNRTVDSKMNFTHNGARAILSAHYYLENSLVSSDKSYTEKGGLLGYAKVGESDGYNIYENQHFIPIGFTFNRCMTEDTYSLILDDDQTTADRLLVEDIILSSEDVERYGYLFEAQDTSLEQDSITTDRYFKSCNERAATACTSFEILDSGFTAETTLSKENLVFFSVPYESGWTASVDGQETEIIKADYGLMAVYVPEGTHTITFTYLPWGFGPAVVISCCAGGVILVMLLARMKWRQRQGGGRMSKGRALRGLGACERIL